MNRSWRGRRARPTGPDAVLRCAATLLTLLAAGCQEPVPGRVFLDIRMDTAFLYGGPADTVLLRMFDLEAFQDGVVATDNDSGRIVFFGPTGEVRWLYERRGQGPFEINRPWDATESRDGTLYVLDANNLKLVELSADGEPLREERLPALTSIPWGIVEVSRGELLLMTGSSRGVRWRPWEGEETPLVPLSYPDTMPSRGLFIQLVYSPGTADGRWVAGMLFGPRWWSVDEAGNVTHHDFINRPGYRQMGELVDAGGGRQVMNTPFQRSSYGALSMAVDEDGVWVLSGGGLGVDDELPGSIIDIYDLHTGEYRHSIRTHEGGEARTSRIAKRGRRLYLMFEDPATRILALDLEDRAQAVR